MAITCTTVDFDKNFTQNSVNISLHTLLVQSIHWSVFPDESQQQCPADHAPSDQAEAEGKSDYERNQHTQT